MTYPILGQNINISGQVVDPEASIPIPGVVCAVLNSKGMCINYTITDENGKYKISLPSNVRISFSHLGYKEVLLQIQDLQKNSLISLYPKIEKLDEVFVQVSPIQWTLDTVTYNAVAFVEKQDRYISDVLKKLPGITIQKNGAISYQGKSISKFYIEGEDLLGSNYNQATQSLPVDAVSQIQVLENHQHIKALKNIKFTDKAALNIRLKEGYKMKLFGNLSLGIGAKPFLWDNELFLTKITKKNQLLSTGKTNNIGKDISDNTNEHIDVADIFSFSPLPQDFITLKQSYSQPIPSGRYLDNCSWVGGFNNLKKLSNNSNIRFNVLFYKDKTNHNERTVKEYGDFLSLKENSVTENKTSFIIPQVQYEHNSELRYIQNEFKASISKNTVLNSIHNGTHNIFSKEQKKPHYLQNKLHLTLQKNNHFYKLLSFSRWVRKRELLELEKDLNLEALKKIEFISKNRISTSFSFLKQQLDIGLDLSIKNEQFNNNIILATPSDLSLSSKYINKEEKRLTKTIGIYSEYNFRYSPKGWVSFSTPISLISLNLERYSKKVTNTSINYFPQIVLHHKINNFIDFKLSSSLEEKTSLDYLQSSIPFIANYRTLYTPNIKNDSESIFNTSKTFRFSSSFSYHNLANMLFINLSGVSSFAKNSHSINYTYANQIAKITPIQKKNNTNFIFISGSVDKTFPDIGFSCKIATDYSRNKYLFLLNNLSLYNTSNIVSSNLVARLKKSSWFSFVYNFSSNYSWQSNEQKRTNSLTDFHHKTQLFLFPSKKLQMSIISDYNTVEIAKNSYKSSLFIDINTQYLLNKRTTIEIYINNLLNRKKYQIATQTGLNYFFTSFPLRQREFLLKINYKI